MLSDVKRGLAVRAGLVAGPSRRGKKKTTVGLILCKIESTTCNMAQA